MNIVREVVLNTWRENIQYFVISLISYMLLTAVALLLYFISTTPSESLVAACIAAAVATLISTPLFAAREADLLVSIRFNTLNLLMKEKSVRRNHFSLYNFYSRASANFLYISQTVAAILLITSLSVICWLIGLGKFVSVILFACIAYFISSTFLTKKIGTLYSKRAQLEERRGREFAKLLREDGSRVNELSIDHIEAEVSRVRAEEHSLLNVRGFYTSIQSTLDIFWGALLILSPHLIYDGLVGCRYVVFSNSLFFCPIDQGYL